jgi:hypothetical protein
MSAATPLVFRPSTAQRAVSALLCAGAWIVGVRGLLLLLQNLPRMVAALKLAQAAGEPVLGLWVGILGSVAASLLGGALLLAAFLALLLVEGSQVLLDELGLAVVHTTLPAPLSRWLGGGRLGWKQVGALERGRIFFRVRGGGETPVPGRREPTLRFLLVDQMDRLVLEILEHSPNLRFPE